jgi:hypothetical protein
VHKDDDDRDAELDMTGDKLAKLVNGMVDVGEGLDDDDVEEDGDEYCDDVDDNDDGEVELNEFIEK